MIVDSSGRDHVDMLWNTFISVGRFHFGGLHKNKKYHRLRPLITGLLRVPHGSLGVGTPGGATGCLRVLYIKGFFCSHLSWGIHTSLKWCIRR